MLRVSRVPGQGPGYPPPSTRQVQTCREPSLDVPSSPLRPRTAPGASSRSLPRGLPRNGLTDILANVCAVLGSPRNHAACTPPGTEQQATSPRAPRPPPRPLCPRGPHPSRWEAAHLSPLWAPHLPLIPGVGGWGSVHPEPFLDVVLFVAVPMDARCPELNLSPPSVQVLHL